jgi:hypothetical protein
LFSGPEDLSPNAKDQLEGHQPHMEDGISRFPADLDLARSILPARLACLGLLLFLPSVTSMVFSWVTRAEWTLVPVWFL